MHTLQLPEAGARDPKRPGSMRNPAGCASSPPADGCPFIGTAARPNYIVRFQIERAVALALTGGRRFSGPARAEACELRWAVRGRVRGAPGAVRIDSGLGYGVEIVVAMEPLRARGLDALPKCRPA